MQAKSFMIFILALAAIFFGMMAEHMSRK